jgi:hypothetical protein
MTAEGTAASTRRLRLALLAMTEVRASLIGSGIPDAPQVVILGRA